MIAYAEGTASYPNDGYSTLFAGGQFEGFADHPRVYVPFRNTTSSAAGRYQILARTWDGVRGKLGLSDFSPASQDAAAVELIRERGALADVQAGRTVRAIGKVAKVWASLPGAGYNQPERKLSALLSAYASAGGTTTEA
ncbi:muramidase [Acidovorax sp. HMWF029]|nr:muramidase [Acidovorax sp. HMWF029]